MDIQIKKLDLGYQQCRDLYSLMIVDGVEFMADLKDLVKKLKKHWSGSDATLHINNLVKIYKDLSVFFTDSIKSVDSVADLFIKMQKVRNKFNASRAIGDNLSKKSISTKLSEVEETKEYFYSESLSKDLGKLEDLIKKFEKIIREFSNISDDLLKNWTLGPGRKEFIDIYGRFKDVAAMSREHLKTSRDKLAFAARNISNIELL